MKKHLAPGILLAALISPFAASAMNNLSAAQSFEGRSLFLGLRKKNQGHTESSALLRLDAKDLQAKPVKLPAELSGREIVAIVPSSRLVVLVTQLTNGGGDAPLVHLLSLKTGRWKKIGSVDCSLLQSLKVAGEKLVFACAPDHTKADSSGKPYAKTMKLGSAVDLGKRHISIPQSDLNLKDVEIQPLLDGTLTIGLKMKVAGQSEKVLSFEALKF